MTDQRDRERYRELKQRQKDWEAANPDHCPECFCRPGKGDAEDGVSDHETFCTLKDSK